MSLRKLIEDFENVITGILKKYKITLTWTFLIMTLTHIYFFVGRFINEDMHGYLSKAPAELISGRYFYGMTEFQILPMVIFAVVFIELAAVIILLLEIFKIEDKILGIITAAFIVTFPSWSYSFVYVFMWDTYSLTLLTAVLAVFIADKYKYGFLPGGFFIACSLSLYQSYIAVSISLAVMILIIELTRKDVKEVIKKALRFLALGILGAVVYKAGIWVFNIELGTYKGADTMGQIPIDMIPALIERTYDGFIHFFTGNNLGVKRVRFFYVPLFITIAYIGCMIFSVVMIILNSGKKPKAVNKIFIAVLLLLLPLAVNFVDFIGVKTSASTLNTYAFVLIFILPTVLLSKYQMNRRGGGDFKRNLLCQKNFSRFKLCYNRV